MNAEPPKPITQLAQPIDRSGPRGPNRLAAVAKWMAILSWFAWMHTMVDYIGPAAALWMWVYTAVGAAAAVAAVALGTVAVVHASRNHLRWRGAITAIVVAALPPVVLVCLHLILWISSR